MLSHTGEMMTKHNHKTEEKDIELEKAKLDLLKHKFDTLLAIVRDVALIAVIAGGTYVNLAQPKSSPAEAPALPSAAMALESSMRPEPTHFLNMHTGLWIVIILAIVFLVLARIPKKPKS